MWGAILGALTGLGGVLGGAGKGAADERGKQNTFNQNQDQTRANIYNTSQDALLQKLLQQSNEATQRYEQQQQATTAAEQGKQSATTQALANKSGEAIELAKLGQSAPLANARASILGSLMKNMQPTSFTSPVGQKGHITQVRGGMNAGALDPLTRQQGDAMLQEALAKQLTGGGVPAPTDFTGGVLDWDTILNPPDATDYSKAIIDAPELSKYKQAGKGESMLSTLGGVMSGIGAVGGAFDKGGGGSAASAAGGAAPTNASNMSMEELLAQIGADV